MNQCNNSLKLFVFSGIAFVIMLGLTSCDRPQPTPLASGTFEKKWDFKDCISTHNKSLFSAVEHGANVAVVVKNTGRGPDTVARDCKFDLVFRALRDHDNDPTTPELLVEVHRRTINQGEETEVLSGTDIKSVTIENCSGGFQDPHCKGEAKISTP